MSFSSPLGPLHFATPSTSTSLLSLFKSKPKAPSASKRSSKTKSQNHPVQISVEHDFGSSSAPLPYHQLSAAHGVEEGLGEAAAILAKELEREQEMLKRDRIIAANLASYGL